MSRCIPVACLFVSFVAFVRAQQPITWSGPVVLETDNSDWTRMVQLSDGSWLAAYMYAGFRNRIRLKRSYDNMRTWQFVTDVVEADRDLDNPALCVLPNGNIVLAVRSYPQRVYYIETFVSSDQGSTFQRQGTVDGGYSPQGVYEPYLYVLGDGSLACFYANEAHQLDNPSYSQTLSERVSVDGGNTWGPEILAVAQPGAARPGTSNIVTLPGNVLAMVYEVCGTEDCKGHVSYSPDGVTWSGEIGPVIPETYQAVVALLMTNGAIVVTSNLLDMVVSTDYTNSWHDPQVYAFASGGWPALYQTGPNEFAVVASNAGANGATGEYILFGTIDPGAFQFPSVPLCKGPTSGRPQDCR